jgi:hypothetical protein
MERRGFLSSIFVALAGLFWPMKYPIVFLSGGFNIPPILIPKRLSLAGKLSGEIVQYDYTVSFKDGSLVAGWDKAIQQRYDEAAKG